VPRWFLRRRRVKRIWIAEAAHAPDRGHALLIRGEATIGAATVSVAPIVGTSRIINLSTRTGSEAERGHKQRQNEPNRFHHLFGTSPSDFPLVVVINTPFSLFSSRLAHRIFGKVAVGPRALNRFSTLVV
jgi:hypothetical protein